MPKSRSSAPATLSVAPPDPVVSAPLLPVSRSDPSDTTTAAKVYKSVSSSISVAAPRPQAKAAPHPDQAGELSNEFALFQRFKQFMRDQDSAVSTLAAVPNLPAFSYSLAPTAPPPSSVTCRPRSTAPYPLPSFQGRSGVGLHCRAEGVRPEVRAVPSTSDPTNGGLGHHRGAGNDRQATLLGAALGEGSVMALTPPAVYGGGFPCAELLLAAIL